MKRKKNRHSTWLRCASFVAAQLAKTESPSSHEDTKRFGDLATEIDQQQLRISIARSRGWKAATEQAKSDYLRLLARLRQQIDLQQEAAKKPSRWANNEVDLFRDLLALKEEFASVVFAPKEKRLAVVTRDIVLEHLQLGAFRIELHLNTMSDHAYYEVIAVNANPASPNESVTHPHVQDDRLCEGEAQPAIKLALQQGRLLDFFQLIEQVLTTYNSSSAYVTTSDWEGNTCGNCGYTTNANETYGCSGCESEICDGCLGRCWACEDSLCGNCDVACESCDESYCKSCVEACSDCEVIFCLDCLTDNRRCTDCEKKSKEEEPETRDSQPEVYGQRLGETVVPA